MVHSEEIEDEDSPHQISQHTHQPLHGGIIEDVQQSASNAIAQTSVKK